MNNYSKLINNLEEKILNFSKKVTIGIDKKKKKEFVSDMLYGMIASSSSYLSEMARKLEEDIPLKSTVKRLSRNLDTFNNDEDDENSPYEDVRNKIVFDSYTEEIKNKIQENTVFCFDPGDMTKNFAKKFEALSEVWDGSTGKLKPGYNMLEVVGLTKNESLPIPVYTRLFSTKEKGFKSVNDEYFNAIEYIKEKYDGKGIFALDRGFDDEKYFKKFVELKSDFVIRMTKKRNITNAESEITENILKKAKRVKMKGSYNYKDKKGITRTAHTGYMKVTIPDLEGMEFYLVVIKSDEFPKDPMMLLTNMKPNNDEFTKIVNKVYIRRWKIEEYFRYKKQQFGFEKELVRSLSSIRTLNLFLTLVIGFIAMFSDNQKQVQYWAVFNESKSLRKNEEIVMVYYAIERGLKQIFEFNSNGIKNKKKKIRPPIDMQMCLF